MNAGNAVTLGSAAFVVGFFAFSAATAAEPIQRTTPNATLVGVQGAPSPGEVVRVDGDGDTETVWEQPGSVHDVTRLSEDRVLVTGATKTTAWVRIINPQTSETVWKWRMPINSIGDSEIHDAEVLPSGNVVIADMDRERLIVVNRSTKKIIWEWRASEHYDAPDDPLTTDWLHINDVDHIGDGRFLVSVRNANQLLIVERGDGVVNVINEDGDRDLLNQQHNPQWLGDGRVLVADSGNNRVVELHRTDGKWEIAWSVSAANGVAFDWPRDADRLPNGHTLITDSRNNRVVEVDQSGDVVWSARVDNLPYEADRVGVGERVGGPTLTGAAQDGRDDWPVVAPIYSALAHVVGLPHWIGQSHIAVLLLGSVGMASPAVREVAA